MRVQNGIEFNASNGVVVKYDEDVGRPDHTYNTLGINKQPASDINLYLTHHWSAISRTR